MTTAPHPPSVAEGTEKPPESKLDVRRQWHLALDGGEHDVVVQFSALSGFMSIEVDGKRVARAWREVQMAVGGANLEARVGDHTLAARATQGSGVVDIQFSLSLDGEVLPGSDAQPTPTQIARHAAAGLITLVTIASATGLAGRFPVTAVMTLGFGAMCVGLVYVGRLPPLLRAVAILSLFVVWLLAVWVLAVAFYHVG
jgi:hypothetical protein